eukprot:7470182-Pyramimonas_sp.AAC.1
MAGWLLLQRAGLNAQARAGVLSSAKNALGLKNLEAARRGQWADIDLGEHDANNRKRDMFPHKPGRGRALGVFEDDEGDPEEVLEDCDAEEDR